MSVRLSNLRIGFACKQRWEDMDGDDRVRACAACDRQVFNLSEMTHEEAERLLATRGVTPCVRFFRRLDGTVMTADCPTGETQPKRRLAVMASSLAAGTALATTSARADNAEPEPVEVPGETVFVYGTHPRIEVGTMELGIPIMHAELRGIPLLIRARPRLEWSVWGRLAWLEEMILLAFRSGALPRKR